MLVLSRRVGQSIIIGNGIEVKIVEVKGDQVRLGIVAPVDVPVHRQEVYEQIQTENRQAAKVPQAQEAIRDLSKLLGPREH